MPVQWSDHIEHQNRRRRCGRCGWDLPESPSRFDAALRLAKSDGDVQDLWADRHFRIGEFDLELDESDGGGLSPKVAGGGGLSSKVSKRKRGSEDNHSVEGSKTLDSTGEKEKDMLHRATLLPAFPKQLTPSASAGRRPVLLPALPKQLTPSAGRRPALKRRS